MVILEKETYEKFGYYPSGLMPQSAKTILATCDGCGVIREIRNDAYHPFCRSCAKKGERSSSWKGGKNIKRICPICKKEFKIEPHRIKWNRGIFCSRECAYNGRNSQKIKVKCPICDKEFYIYPYRLKEREKIYCSCSCARKARRFPKHHTKPKMIFEQICKNNNLPFKYTGNGSFWIGKLNPDFIECNGKRIVVEIFGDYWHSPLLNQNMKECSALEYRKRYYKKYKWDSIFIWESDLKREDAEEFVLLQLCKY